MYTKKNTSTIEGAFHIKPINQILLGNRNNCGHFRTKFFFVTRKGQSVS